MLCIYSYKIYKFVFSHSEVAPEKLIWDWKPDRKITWRIVVSDACVTNWLLQGGPCQLAFLPLTHAIMICDFIIILIHLDY